MHDPEKHIKSYLQNEFKKAEASDKFTDMLMERIGSEQRVKATPLIPKLYLWLGFSAFIGIGLFSLILFDNTLINNNLFQNAWEDFQQIAPVLLACLSSMTFFLIIDRIVRKRKGLI